MSKRALLRRLASREYLPLVGWLLCWVIIAAGIGHADAARLLAATMLVRAARSLTVMETAAAMRRRHGAEPRIYRKSLIRALRIEAVALLAGAAVLALLIAGLFAIGQDKAALMTMLVGIGLPARHLAPAGGGRRRPGLFHLTLAWSGLLLALGAILADLGPAAVAVAMGLREWVAVLAMLLPGIRPPPHPEPKPVTEPLTLREVASITSARARERLTYRIGKSLLVSVLGPFGAIIARTGRGVGMHRRFERLTPKKVLPILILALASGATAILIQVLLAKPATLILSASLIRICAGAGSVLLWWRFAGPRVDEADEDDDD